MKKINLEKPDSVFLYAPQIQDICIEFGIDKSEVEIITCMYEVFKRMNGKDRVEWDEEDYNDGYKDGYNDVIEEVESRVDDLSWEIGRLKKN